MHGHNFAEMTIEEKENYTKNTILYMLEETHELLREINFKTYKKVRKPIVIENIKEELCDILSFFLNLAIAWDVTPEALAEAYFTKNQKNVERVCNKNY